MVRGNPTQWFKTVTWALVFAYQDRAGVHFLNMLVQIMFTTKSFKKTACFEGIPSKQQAHLPLDPPTYLLSLYIYISLPPISPQWPHRTPWMSKYLSFSGGVGDLGPKASWVPLKVAIDVFFVCWPCWAQDALEQLKGCHWSLGSCWLELS